MCQAEDVHAFIHFHMLPTSVKKGLRLRTFCRRGSGSSECERHLPRAAELVTGDAGPSTQVVPAPAHEHPVNMSALLVPAMPH